MGDFFFVVKCFVVTFALVVVMQIKVGGDTMEEHTVNWIHSSNIVRQLQDVAEGAVKAGRNGSREVAGLFEDSTDGVLDDVMPRSEASTGWFKVKRSDAYYRQKARERSRRESDERAVEKAKTDRLHENDEPETID